MADGALTMADMQHTVPGPDTQRDFRNALGRFTTGVTVVTAPTENGPVGITVNSFASVSLDPPLIMWCPAKASHRFPHFFAARHFAIHVMGTEHSTVAQNFANSASSFDGLTAHVNGDGVTVFDDCIARYECTTVQTHDAGDHLIIVGRVTLAAHREGEALVFSRGLYGRFMGV
jgi:flavin reductase (DIM6/NTAB) family NADH-FMN oxidoreductase RutF